MPDEKSDQPPSSSPPSSSAQPLDRSLVRAFGALEATLADFTTATQNNNSTVQQLVRQVSDLSKQIAARAKIDDDHRGKLLDALVHLTDSFDKLVQQENIAVGATVDARNALLAAKDQLDRSVKEVTGQHPLLPPDDPDGAPRFLQVIVLHLTNFGWKNKAKMVGWFAIAATSLIHAWQQIAPWFHGVFR